MSADELSTPVFRTTEPEILGKAAVLLKEADVPYDVETRPGVVGGKLRNRSSHTILVSRAHMSLAQKNVAGLPSEFVLETGQKPVGHAKVSPRIVLIIIVISLIFLILAIVLGSGR